MFRIRHIFLLCALVCALVLTTPSVSVAAASCARPYVAVKNDSWSRIAGKTGVTLSALLKQNKATTKTMILVGATVCLPKGTTWNQPSTKATGLRNLGTPSTRYTRAQAAAVIREIFPERLHERALAIAQRESKLNAASWNWCCIGLFQINWWSHRPWLEKMGITDPEQLLNARTNAEAALALYRRSNGWGPWE